MVRAMRPCPERLAHTLGSHGHKPDTVTNTPLEYLGFKVYGLKVYGSSHDNKEVALMLVLNVGGACMHCLNTNTVGVKGKIDHHDRASAVYHRKCRSDHRP
jgi:hypothetical protein